ncbi:MAG: crossover junction endodeoxyribonuclease RuvC [Bacteroidaceae bacterium]|nr:crossover junction endodeoxyribonuclease RuvC [Bacteroidaceae bacterium]
MSSMEDSIILGIDPGTNVLGYGVVSVGGRQVSLLAMGVIDLRKCKEVYTKLGRIYERVDGLIKSFRPKEMAIEAPFFGKNIQSMLKLGRAQGVAIAAAIAGGVEVHEYAPTKIKLALTGQGAASKEQVAVMLQHIFHIQEDKMVPFMDATDAVAVAYCHYLQRGGVQHRREYSGWGDFVKKNAARVSRRRMPEATAEAVAANPEKPESHG